jgi:pimeloyl-ACP methyl ester carboxylesterase
VLRLRDGRDLAWEDTGGDGPAILYCHGSPGSRLERRVFFDDGVLKQNGVRLITPDRPGCGHSTFQLDRRIADWTSDIRALVKHLQLPRFSVLGFSGGTPYAMALAASDLPVTALGIVSGEAPPGRVAGVHLELPEKAERSPLATSAMLRGVAAMAQLAPRVALGLGTKTLAPADLALVSEPDMRRRYADTLRDALAQGPAGVLLDLQLAARDWPVRAPRSPIPIFVWHGESDTSSPVSIACYLAAQLPRPQLKLIPGEGRVSAFARHVEQIIRSLAP